MGKMLFADRPVALLDRVLREFRNARMLARIISSALLVLVAHPVTAGDDDYCATGDKYYPRGAIVHLGERYFRICTGVPSAPPRKILPSIVTEFPATFGGFGAEELFTPSRSVIIEDYSSRGGRRKYPIYDTTVGQIVLGGVPYLVNVSTTASSRIAGEVHLGDLPSSALYIMHDASTGYPEHFFFCSSDFSAERSEGFNCNIHVEYPAASHLFVSHRKAWIPNNPFAPEPFDFNLMPDLAEALLSAITRMDVTDRLNDFSDLPIIRLRE